MSHLQLTGAGHVGATAEVGVHPSDGDHPHGACVVNWETPGVGLTLLGSTISISASAYLVQLRVTHVVGHDVDGAGIPDDLIAPLLHGRQGGLGHRVVQLNVGHTHLGGAALRQPPGQCVGVMLVLQYGGEQVLAGVLLHVVPTPVPVHHLGDCVARAPVLVSLEEMHCSVPGPPHTQHPHIVDDALVRVLASALKYLVSVFH